jgi:hypothetical protein
MFDPELESFKTAIDLRATSLLGESASHRLWAITKGTEPDAGK